MALNKVNFALVIHAHQPVGNFDHVIEEAYQKSYRPFAEVLLRHPTIRLCLHASGILLEWLEAHHPEFFDLLGQLARRGQVEFVGGGYYEPILVSIPNADKIAQVRKLAGYLQKHFGAKPGGAWVAERVWEPSLARPLAQAGAEYVILDDTHFLAAGLDLHELRGSYITEEAGLALRLVPSLKSLRYTIPFHEPEETLRVLREGCAGAEAGSPLFTMGDDWEKFGVWPGTFEHCYKNGWLEKFMAALEGAADWLETTTLSDYLADHAPLGRVYLPAASYEEMMEWSLPVAPSHEFRSALEEIDRMPSAAKIHRFMRGGMWRNFLAKYPESNQIHKLMLEVSRRWHHANAATKPGTHAARLLDDAHAHLLASQCNDAYWHGVFGGLYAPHLRSAVLSNLIRAEVLLDKLSDVKENSPPRVQTKDFDVDGQREVLVEHPSYSMVMRPADGGTISSLRFKPADVELINSLMRREEAYHEKVLRHVGSEAAAPREGPASIHDHVWSKESNLSALLRYDRYPRNLFRTFVFPAGQQCKDFDYLCLRENLEIAQGKWDLPSAGGSPGVFPFTKRGNIHIGGKDMQILAAKTIEAKAGAGSLRLDCRSSLSMEQSTPAPLALGVELVFNLLAPDVPDRYFLANQVRQPLEFRGEIVSDQLTMVDEWQKVKISMEASPKPSWWIVPIETISQSESGFERVYQGSAILAVWKIEPSSWQNISCDLQVNIERLGEK
ncbi:MAG TPA: alpha-amylase/4-alpha-glucanotransferase domain-containing protein [Terriglobia bacterium]|nr:alpha-amylase/4-alpha-glucanotransferase domain-containing protein [Terriglobia bacterium]